MMHPDPPFVPSAYKFVVQVSRGRRADRRRHRGGGGNPRRASPPPHPGLCSGGDDLRGGRGADPRVSAGREREPRHGGGDDRLCGDDGPGRGVWVT